MEYRYDIEQNTDEWIAIKVGKFSASVSAELQMDKKTKGYIGLIDKIVEERITGLPCEGKWGGNSYTNRGHEFEPMAIQDYELRNLQVIKRVGVIELNDWVLCSPDGLINDNAHYQAKCPIFNTQKYSLLDKDKKILSPYYKQIQFELFVSDREYCVFNSFHPSLPAFDKIIYRDEEMISNIGMRLEEGKIEVLNQINQIKSIS